MGAHVLDRRRLNRATLTRQLLDRRRALPTITAVEHLVGLQAQKPLEPYAGLWSRVQGFSAADLAGLLESRRAVRTVLMRRSLHLVSAEDCLSLRPLHQRMLISRMLRTLRRQLAGTDLDDLTAAAAPHFHGEPQLPTDVARTIGYRWPRVAARDLGDALDTLVPLVQVPPRGVWGSAAAARCLSVEHWLGRALGEPDDDDLDALVLRYLRAYGPAATADVRAWSGLTGLPAVIERLRPQLRAYRDEGGRELLDVEDAPLPDPDSPVPPRFLPAFDNAVLGYHDRSRIIDDRFRPLSIGGARFVLLDGRVTATWAGDRPHPSAPVTVTITPLRALTAAERDAVEREGALLATFLGDGVVGRASLVRTP